MYSSPLARLAAPALTALLCLSGCAVGPNFTRPKPNLPAQWSRTAVANGAADTNAPTAPSSSVPDPLAQWWKQFEDPTLSSLITRSAGSSLDLQASVLRITEARAQSQIERAGWLPTVSANASFTRQRLSDTTATGALFTKFGGAKIPGAPAAAFPNPYNQSQLGLGASWELDLFGRVRRAVEAADADVQASVEDQHAVLVSLYADVGRTYIELRGAQLRLDVTRQSLATQTELYDLTRQRETVGLTSALDVANAGAQLSSTQALVPGLDREITADINQLSLLMGREPDALRTELEPARPVPPVPPALPVTLPAELARRRPDIRQAEARLHAATARIGLAVGNLFPRLTLSASGGFQAQSASDLLKWASRFGSVGPAFELPIFDGARWGTVRLQNIKAQEAAVDYSRTVLAALHEVENALAAYKADTERSTALNAAVSQSSDALELARQRYASGVANFIDVLDAERTLQQNQLALAESTAAVSADLVAIYRSLGGGWDTAAS